MTYKTKFIEVAIVLCSDDGEPNEWSASDLKVLHTAGKIRLHQSQLVLTEISI